MCLKASGRTKFKITSFKLPIKTCSRNITQKFEKFLASVLSIKLSKRDKLTQYWQKNPQYQSITVKNLLDFKLFQQILNSLSYYKHNNGENIKITKQIDESYQESSDLSDNILHIQVKKTPENEQYHTKKEDTTKCNNFAIRSLKSGNISLESIQKFIDMIQKQFLFNAKIDKNKKFVTIDESVSPYKGRFISKVYLPLKPSKYGLLFRMASCPSTGYCYKILFYTQNQKGKTIADIFSQLLTGYESKFEVVCSDNYFSTNNSIAWCKQNNLEYIGTIRSTRYQPKNDNEKVKILTVQQSRIVECENFFVQEWQAKKTKIVRVVFTSNLQGIQSTPIKKQKLVIRPYQIENYNILMKGVDQTDFYLKLVRWPHKNYKWTTNLFFYLLDLVLVNSYLTFKNRFEINSLEFKTYVNDLLQVLLQNIGKKDRKHPNYDLKNIITQGKQNLNINFKITQEIQSVKNIDITNILIKEEINFQLISCPQCNNIMYIINQIQKSDDK